MTVALIVIGSAAILVAGICWCGREMRRIVEVDSQLTRVTALRRRQLDNEIARGRAGSPHPADTVAGNDDCPPHGIPRPHQGIVERVFPSERCREPWS